LSQYDRQWVNTLSHTAKEYYNRAWYRRQVLRQVAQSSYANKAGQQTEDFFGPKYTTDSTAPFIDVQRIYGQSESK
jgi:hypothetical protein